jgi:3'-phosphoadenosine 5'-phosphosulfate sulfotransferase (PAPS reductase)/FAD synthetase
MPTFEELRHLQSQSLERKVRLTQTRILEWHKRWNGQVYVSFSGGKDSTVLLDLARRMYPDIEAVFVDTGLEYPEIKEFVKSKENVTILRPKMSFREVIKKYGYPIISKEVSDAIYCARNKPDGHRSKKFDPNSEYCLKYGKRFDLSKWKFLLDSDIPISHMCCNVMKKDPVKKFEKETGKKPIIGTMTEESVLRQSEWLKTGCNGFNAKRPSSKPMSFWTKQDVLRYLKETGISYANVYGDIVPKGIVGQLIIEGVKTDLMTTGCNRTGCVFCMFGVHIEEEPNRFQRLKHTHPKLYEYCMRDWEDGGLGLSKVLDFISVKY